MGRTSVLLGSGWSVRQAFDGPRLAPAAGYTIGGAAVFFESGGIPVISGSTAGRYM